jgi:hypothetical protein
LAPLGRFWCQFGAHWILQGIPKSTIFGTKKMKKLEKGGPRNGYEKT